MKYKPWTKEQTSQLLNYHAQGFPAKWIGDQLGRTEQAVRLKLIDQGYSSKVATKPQPLAGTIQPPQPVTSVAPAPQWTPPPTATPPVTPSVANTTVEEDMARRRQMLLAEEAKETVRKYEQVLKQRAVEDRIVGIFADRIAPFTSPIDLPDLPKNNIGVGEPNAAVLLLGDTHVGQCVASGQTNGFGDYNPRRYCEKLKYWEEAVLRLLPASGERTVDELHLFLLGDILHGMLNHSAEREDTLLVADQFTLAVWTLHQSLTRIASMVPVMHIYCVVGNHGRWPNQRKMPSTNRYSNLDHLVYSSLHHAMSVRGLSNIRFHLNDAPRQVVKIKDCHVQASHGDHLRGGDKQLAIPVHAIAKEINATSQRRAAASRPAIDYYVCGDKHKPISLPTARGSYIINGAWAGVDEYAMNFPPAESVQTMFWIHPVLRKTYEYSIKLDFAPRLTDLPYALPDSVRYLVEDGYTPPTASQCA